METGSNPPNTLNNKHLWNSDLTMFGESGWHGGRSRFTLLCQRAHAPPHNEGPPKARCCCYSL